MIIRMVVTKEHEERVDYGASLPRRKIKGKPFKVPTAELFNTVDFPEEECTPKK